MYTPHLMLQEENQQSSVIYFIEDRQRISSGYQVQKGVSSP